MTTVLKTEWANASLLLSYNTLLPHSTARLPVRHRAKGQTRVLSVTHDPAMTQRAQIHQAGVTSEFTGVAYCSKTHRHSVSHVDPQIIIPRGAVLQQRSKLKYEKQSKAHVSMPAFTPFSKEMKSEMLTSHDELSLSAPLLWSVCVFFAYAFSEHYKMAFT